MHRIQYKPATLLRTADLELPALRERRPQVPVRRAPMVAPAVLVQVAVPAWQELMAALAVLVVPERMAALAVRGPTGALAVAAAA